MTTRSSKTKMPSVEKQHRRKSRITKKKPAQEGDDAESSDSDLDLGKEVHPIGHYLSDRAEMLDQVFSVLKGTKLRAMLPTALKDLRQDELKRLCLEELEGMSKKRIVHVLAGKEMDESSDTDDEDEKIDYDCVKSSIGQEGASASQTVSSKEDLPIKMRIDTPLPDESGDSDEDGFRKVHRKKIKEEKPLKVDVRLKKHKRKSSEEDALLTRDLKRLKDEEAKKAGAPLDQASTSAEGTKVMELLELEMRKRAIKALLTKSGRQGSIAVNCGDAPAETATPSEPVTEEEKRLQKAREALFQSEAKKKEADELLERRETESRRRQDEVQRRKEQVEAEARKKLEAEDEKRRKKEQKEQEYAKFLEYKKEKLRQEEEQKERERLESRSKLKAIQEAETKRKRQDVDAPVTTVRRKKQHEQEVEEDNLERDFEISLDYGSSDDDAAKVNRRKEDGGQVRSYRQNKLSEEDAPRGEDKSPGLSSVSSSRTRGSRAASTPTLSSLSSDEEDEDKHEELIRKSRLARLQEVRRKHRKRKPAEDIEDGEVDSEGEHFEPEEEEEEEEDLEKYDLGSVAQEVSPSEGGRDARASQAESVPTESSGSTPAVDQEIGRDEVEGIAKVSGTGIERESDDEKLLSSEDDDEDKEPVPLEVTSEGAHSREGIKDERDSAEDADDADRESRKRMERQREERLRRMQAFQQKTEIREEDDHGEGGEDQAQEEHPESSEFYKSFYEEEQKKKEVEEAKSDDAAAEVAAEPEAEAGPSRAIRSPKRGKKSHEEKIREGVGFWSQLCSTEDSAKGKTKEPSLSKEQSLPSSNADLPSKEEVEKQQREMESLTWADRWYQNKKVQSVVKNSKIMSKVRSQIKIRDLKARPAAEGSSAEHFEELPKIIGSMEEYAQIVGKTTKEIDAALVKRREESDDESEDDNDDVWATILGKPKE